MSRLNRTAFQILLLIKEKYFTSQERLENYIEHSLELADKDCKYPQKPDFLLEQARESGRTHFKLIGKVNDGGLQLMEWCDEAWNFDGMCSDIEIIKTHKDGEYMKRTYTLEELPEVIDNALSWFNSMKSKKEFWDEHLHILAI